jgi:HD-GYP domain-containing protein (c-di-GMP phosphodiesterase class II)
MTSHRPYRPALGVDAACEEISKHRGTQHDAEALDACLAICECDGALPFLKGNRSQMTLLS